MRSLLSFTNLTKSFLRNQTMPPKTRSDISSAEPDKVLQLLTKLDTKIDKISSDFKVNLDKQTVSVRNKFQKHLMYFDNKLINVINIQSDKVSELELINENNNRIARLNDVIIKGVPIMQNEKLFEIFDKISAAIKFNQSKFTSLNNLFRLKAPNNSLPAPILLQFSTQLLRREFMSKYFAHGKLKLSNIGISSENRIYACDNLTKLNNNIFQKALKMVTNKQLTKVRTRAGFVYVQFTNTDELVPIKNIDELQDSDDDQLNDTVCEVK